MKTVTNNGFKKIISRFDTTCRNCENAIKAGEEIFWKPGMAICSEFCIETMPKEQAETATVKPKRDLPRIPDGTYTVVFPDGDYQTVKFETPSKGPFTGRRIASFLSGPDNENHFTGFAFVSDDNRLHPWKRFQHYNVRDKVMEAVRVLYRSGEEGLETAGEAYAMRSGKCCKCGRTLTVPASLHRGMGPICADKEW